MQLSQQTYDDKITSYRQSWSGRVQACNYPSKLMKTKQRRSDGHGLVEYKHATIPADLWNKTTSWRRSWSGRVQACNYPSRLMKIKQRRSDGHGLVEYKHATIPATLWRQYNVVSTVMASYRRWYDVALRYCVARTLKILRSSKGDYWIEQWFSSISSVYKMGTSLSEQIISFMVWMVLYTIDRDTLGGSLVKCLTRARGITGVESSTLPLSHCAPIYNWEGQSRERSVVAHW